MMITLTCLFNYVHTCNIDWFCWCWASRYYIVDRVDRTDLEKLNGVWCGKFSKFEPKQWCNAVVCDLAGDSIPKQKTSDVLEARRSNFIPPLRSIHFAMECKADKLLKHILNWNMGAFNVFGLFWWNSWEIKQLWMEILKIRWNNSSTAADFPCGNGFSLFVFF